jgi:uncharacterized membrane protein YhaH (DUF805 family)
MTFTESISTCFKKYATFTGRASRSEYWWFSLFCVIVGLALSTLFGDGSVVSFANIILILPSISVACRRLHDVGRSGWWQLLAITLIGILILIYWYVQPSKEVDNKYAV